MIAPRFIPLVMKQLLRHRARTALTALGVGSAMFLFSLVQALDRGVTEATHQTGRETTLVVYRENRFCPFASRLPEGYAARIARIDGVASVVPMRIVVNNCRASLDVVTFRGVPREALEGLARRFEVVAGSLEEWERRGDGALVGETLATRRRLKVGDALGASGVTAYVAGIIRSDQPQDWNVAYVSLGFLQRAAARGGDGIVTQFNVTVDDPSRLEEVAAAIDEEFRHDAEPTDTRPEKAFVARAAHDVVRLAGFMRGLGWAALAAVLGLVANAIVLSVRDRVKEHAVLRTLGFRTGLIARLVVVEAAALGLIGGVLGCAAAYGLLRASGYSLSVEGTSLPIRADAASLALGLAIAAGAGVAAGLLPGLLATRRQIAECFRAV